MSIYFFRFIYIIILCKIYKNKQIEYYSKDSKGNCCYFNYKGSDMYYYYEELYDLFATKYNKFYIEKNNKNLLKVYNYKSKLTKNYLFNQIFKQNYLFLLDNQNQLLVFTDDNIIIMENVYNFLLITQHFIIVNRTDVYKVFKRRFIPYKICKEFLISENRNDIICDNNLISLSSIYSYRPKTLINIDFNKIVKFNYFYFVVKNQNKLDLMENNYGKFKKILSNINNKIILSYGYIIDSNKIHIKYWNNYINLDFKPSSLIIINMIISDIYEFKFDITKDNFILIIDSEKVWKYKEYFLINLYNNEKKNDLIIYNQNDYEFNYYKFGHIKENKNTIYTLSIGEKFNKMEVFWNYLFIYLIKDGINILKIYDLININFKIQFFKYPKINNNYLSEKFLIYNNKENIKVISKTNDIFKENFYVYQNFVISENLIFYNYKIKPHFLNISLNDKIFNINTNYKNFKDILKNLNLTLINDLKHKTNNNKINKEIKFLKLKINEKKKIINNMVDSLQTSKVLIYRSKNAIKNSNDKIENRKKEIILYKYLIIVSIFTFIFLMIIFIYIVIWLIKRYNH